MKEVNLDDLPPVRILETLKEWELNVPALAVAGPQTWLKARTWCRLHPETGIGRLGCNARTLLDWRHIERRYHAILTESQRFSDTFWGSLRTLSEHLKAHGKSREIWIPLNSEHALVYNKDESLYTQPIEKLIKEGIPNPDYQGHLVQGQERIDALRLYARSNTLHRRAGVFQSAFTFAVKARLKSYVNSHLSTNIHRRYGYVTPATFVISNEGREYVVTCDQGGTLKFIFDQPIVVCR